MKKITKIMWICVYSLTLLCIGSMVFYDITNRLFYWLIFDIVLVIINLLVVYKYVKIDF